MYKSELRRKIYTDDDRNLINYLKEEFGYCSKRSMYEVRNKIDIIYSLEKKTLELGITRMKTIEEANDFSKFISPTVVMVLALITSYNSFLVENFNKGVVDLIQLIILGTALLYIKSSMDKYRKKRMFAAYVINLFDFALKTKGNSN